MADYCDNGDVGRILNTTFSTSTTPQATAVDEICGWMSAYIESRTGQKWSTSTVTQELHDGNGGPYVFLNNYPIIAITSVEVDMAGIGSTANWTTRTEGRDSDFIAYKGGDGKQGYLYFHENIPDAVHQNVRVSYTHGRASTPEDIKMLCAQLAAIEVLKIEVNNAETANIKKFTVGDASYEMDTAREFMNTYTKRAEALFGTYKVRARYFMA